MKHKMKFRKRVTSLFLVLVMVLSMIPMASFTAGAETWGDEDLPYHVRVTREDLNRLSFIDSGDTGLFFTPIYEHSDQLVHTTYGHYPYDGSTDQPPLYQGYNMLAGATKADATEQMDLALYQGGVLADFTSENGFVAISDNATEELSVEKDVSYKIFQLQFTTETITREEALELGYVLTGYAARLIYLGSFTPTYGNSIHNFEPKSNEYQEWEECFCGATQNYSEHTHSYEEIKFNMNQHWGVCRCGKEGEFGEHVYDNRSDAVCNVCEYTRYSYQENENGTVELLTLHAIEDNGSITRQQLNSLSFIDSSATQYYIIPCNDKDKVPTQGFHTATGSVSYDPNEFLGEIYAQNEAIDAAQNTLFQEAEPILTEKGLTKVSDDADGTIECATGTDYLVYLLTTTNSCVDENNVVTAKASGRLDNVGQFSVRRNGHTAGEYTPVDDDTHSFICSVCNAETTEKHSGGTATCVVKAVCQHCKTSYGEVDTDNHDESVVFTNGFCENGCYEPAVLNDNGTPDNAWDDYYEISNAGQLYWFADKVNNDNANFRSASAVLTDDIVVNEGVMTAESEGARVWTPIGNSNSKYSGSFDGNNHTISGLYFNNTEAYDVGLFGDMYGGIVTNTGVINSYFCGYQCVGALVGSISYGKIINNYNASVVNGEIRVGGVVGSFDSGTLTNCYNSGVVTGSTSVGGVSGYCIGMNITGCYNTGVVNGSKYVGGVIGSDSSGTITNCYNTGAVNGKSSVGGVIGNTTMGMPKFCYSTGAVTGDTQVGGVIGYKEMSAPSKCYYLDTTCTGGINGADSAGSAEAKTLEQFKSGEVAFLLQGTQTTEIWGQEIGTEDYPLLGSDKVYQIKNCKGEATYSNTNEDIDHNFEGDFCTICHSPTSLYDADGDGYFDIEDAEDLYLFAELVNSGKTNMNAELLADIVVNEGDIFENSTDVKVWTPVGNSESNAYTGTFEGNNKFISGLFIKDETLSVVGLFSHVAPGGVIKNTGVINSYFRGGLMVGNIVGHSVGKVINCYSTSEVKGDEYVGGVVGSNKGTISNCYNTGVVRGTITVGGITGYSSGVVEYSYNTGYVGGNGVIGGVVGRIFYETGIIKNCYNRGEVNGKYNTGGVIGELVKGTMINCYNAGKVNCEEAAGGAVGYSEDATVSNCYYLDTCYASDAFAVAKTKAQFNSGEVAFLLQGEMTDEIWGQKIGVNMYPALFGAIVYQVTGCKNETNYANSKSSGGGHIYENGFCIGCGAYEPCPGSGTAAEPYKISNAGQLYWFAAVVNEGYGAVAQNAEVHAKLMADIIVNEGPLTHNTADARVWIPIGKCQSASYGGPGEGVAFKGTFDGNGFTISGLYHPYSKEMYDYAGFIGCLQGDNSQVKDLGIINCFIGSRYIAAGIVGTNDGGTVENCYVTGTISTGAHGAGIAGKNTGTVTECYNDALIEGLSFGGGIVAFNEGTVSKCYNIGDCRFDTGGGIAYQSTGLVEECYNVVDLSFSRHGAGIVWNGKGEVIRCYNTGNISSPLFKVCGVAGVADKIIDCYNTGDISGDTAFGVGSSYTLVKNCYNTGRITAKSYAVGACPTGGIVTSENCYYLEGMVTAAGTVDVDVQGKSEAKSAEAFTSGEVAYLLQNNREEQIWGQKLGEENIPQFSENKVYKNQIGGCNEVNFVYEYSNTQENAVTTHPGEWIIDASWSPESSESCYVYIDVYCNDCGDYLDYTSCEAELISEEAPINCQNPGKREWSCTFTVSDRTFTETYTEVLRNDVHTDINDDGFCTACGGYEKPEVDPGEDPEWDYDDVYLIYNAGQLYWFAEHANNVNNGICGKLMADIDLNPGFTFKSDGSYSFGGIEGPFGGEIIGPEPPRMWTPIGSGSPCYAGSFDGNGFVVSGAYAVSENYYVGLFGNTDYNYEIKNLGISNSYFEGSAYVGGLAGYAYTYIHNCYVTDTVYVNGGSNTAALVGYNGVEIWNSYAMSDTLTGGGWGSLYNCYYLADEEIHNEDGLTFKTAEQFESGEVAFLLQSGQVGEPMVDDDGYYIYDEDGNLVYDTENVPHVWGQKIGTDTYPVFGGDKVYTVKNCKDEVAGYSNTEGKTLDHTFENGFCTACGEYLPATDENEDGVLEISNAGQLYWFAEFVNAGNTSANAILTADIVVNEGTVTESSTDARVWTPIGNWSNKYTGTFDGNDYTVSGLYFNDSEVHYVGFFGVIGENGAVKNTGVINSYFNGDECVGGVSGYNFGTVTNCYSTAKISADRFAGGIVGCSYGIVANSYNTGKVNGNNCISGVVGISQFGTIINCYNTGEVSGTTNVGGILGESYSATIANCYNTGTVDGNHYFGAIFGYGRNDDASNCFYLDSSCRFATGDDSLYGPITSIAKTSGAFASGEVAYLLQGEQTEEIWGQKIGTDTYPVLGGDKVYATTDSDGNITSYTNTNPFGKLAGYTISLGDKIAVNYYMSLTEKTLNDANAKMVFTVPDTGSTYTVEIPVSQAAKNGDYYVFTCEVAAKEMTSVIKAKLVTSESEVQLDDYTVQKYAEVILSDTVKYSKEQALVKAMLNYGAYAQVYFNYNTEDLANDSQYISDDDKVLPDTIDLSGYKATIAGEEEGVSFYGSALSLKSETAIKLYFKVDGDASLLDVTVNGEAYTLTKNGNLYEIKISDIPAHLLTKMYEVKVGGITITYGAMSYADTALSTDKSGLKNAVKALCLYAQAAENYLYVPDVEIDGDETEIL